MRKSTVRRRPTIEGFGSWKSRKSELRTRTVLWQRRPKGRVTTVFFNKGLFVRPSPTMSGYPPPPPNPNQHFHPPPPPGGAGFGPPPGGQMPGTGFHPPPPVNAGHPPPPQQHGGVGFAPPPPPVGGGVNQLNQAMGNMSFQQRSAAPPPPVPG